MNITQIMRWAYAHMDYPWALLLAIVLIPLLFWFFRKEFIAVKDSSEARIQKKKVRRLMYFTRTILVLLLLGAIASPYFQTQKVIEGDPYIDLLIDNSTSMSVFQDVSSSLA